MKSKISPRFVATAGIIAALYCIATLISTLCGMSSGIIQIRLSEAFCVLPVFTPAAIPGLFAGCILSNIISGCSPLDVVFGSLATLAGALLAYLISKMKIKDGVLRGALATLPNVIANTIAIPLILKFIYGLKDALTYIYVCIGIEEILSGMVLGTLLYLALYKRKNQLFRD